MALIKCTECGGSVSNAAMFCPHCGVASPALTTAEKTEAVTTYQRGSFGRLGGWAFLGGILWLIIIGASGAGPDAVTVAWGVAKYLIIGGAIAYFISEIDRNIFEMKRKKRK